MVINFNQFSSDIDMYLFAVNDLNIFLKFLFLLFDVPPDIFSPKSKKSEK